MSPRFQPFAAALSTVILFGAFACGGPTNKNPNPENCSNAIDDDGDDQVDCSDSQCEGKSCGAQCICTDGAKVTSGGSGGGAGGGAGGGTSNTGGGSSGTGGGDSGGFTYSWSIGSWPDCSNGCGAGTQTRTAVCTRSDGMTVADALCTQPKPATSQSCSGTFSCLPCNLPWGGTLNHGASTTAYLDALPDATCTPETRTCTNGVLSGSYTFFDCERGCTMPWGEQITSGSAQSAYSSQFGTAPYTCAQRRQLRTCTDGTLSGTYTFATCKNYSCPLVHETLGEALFRDGAVNFPTSMFQTAPTSQVCNGATLSWSNTTIYNGPTGTACEWGGRWFEQGTCGLFESKGWICSAGSWAVSTVNCPQFN